MGWRERNAPYGLQQLAYRLGVTTDQLLSRPDIVASAVGQMEGGRAGAKHVAESFMDFVDRNGGGREGVLKAIPHYDTMVMTNPRQIGNLAGAQNMTIAQLNRDDLRPTFEHLNAVKSRQAQRVVPEGYTKNFSAPYPGIPGGGQNYRVVQAPDGSTHRVPYWATDAIAAGRFTRSPSGEYLVPENGQKPYQVAWSNAGPPVDPGVGPGGQRIAANPVTPIPEGRMTLGVPVPPPEPPPSQVQAPAAPPIAPAPPPVPTAVQPAPPDKWDLVQQQAERNQDFFDAQRKAGAAQTVGGNQGFFGNPGFQGSGDFFRALDGSGYKSGGAVKASKDQAKYRGHPNRGDKCRDCSMFQAPHGCTAVRGAISPYGWCEYFEATPTAVALAIKKAAGQVELNPTALQKEWGNYSKGHFNWHDLEITIENPKGAIRTGGKPGATWSVKMPAVYGYIKKTVGRDGDHVDVYVGDDHASDKVWIIDQVDAATGKFDEHKCMLSFKTKAQAIATYNKGFSDGKGPDRMGAVSELPVEKFKDWLKGDTTKPMGKIVRRRADGGKVQDLDALSNGIPQFTPAELAIARANREARAATTPEDDAAFAKMQQVRDSLGIWPQRYVDIDQPRGEFIDATLQGIDAMRPPGYMPGEQQSDNVEVRRADGGRVNALDVARKYNRGR